MEQKTKTMTQEESKNVRVAGYSSQKQHWQLHKIHGVQTSCRKRLSYAANGNKDFFNLLKNYPDMCCKKCAHNFKEHVRQQLNKKA